MSIVWREGAWVLHLFLNLEFDCDRQVKIDMSGNLYNADVQNCITLALTGVEIKINKSKDKPVSITDSNLKISHCIYLAHLAVLNVCFKGCIEGAV